MSRSLAAGLIDGARLGWLKPLLLPLGTVSATRPEIVGTLTLAPSTASSIVIESSLRMSSPWRSNPGCGRIRSST